MPSGWTRWLLEQFEFPFQLVYAPELDKGARRFDVLILVDGAYRHAALVAVPRAGGGGDRRRSQGRRPADERPATDPYRDQRGGQRSDRHAAIEEIPRGRAARSSPSAARRDSAGTWGCPLANHLAEVEGVAPTSRCRKQVLRAVFGPADRMDPTDPLAWGMGDRVDVMFSTVRRSGSTARRGYRPRAFGGWVGSTPSAAEERLGLGPGAPRGGLPSSMPGSARAASASSGPGPVPGPAARDVQVCFQRYRPVGRG